MKNREIAGVKVFVSNEAYDEYKGTLQEQINELQSNWNSLRKIIKDCYKRYEDSNIELNDTYKFYLKSPLPPRYTMNLGAIELIDYLLDNMNELEGGEDENN